MTATALGIDGVSVSRGGRQVLHDISLAVPAGEVTTLLGANGAGKSSLVLAIGGVLRPSAGAIRVGDDDISRKAPEKIRARGVAIVAEGRRLLPNLTVEENLQAATYFMRRPARKAALGRATELFPELEKHWTRQSSWLSGGEQQMVVLAQALVSEPSYLIVDELSLGLAPVVVKRLAPVLAEAAAGGIGVLMIEQFASIALGLAERAYVLEGGRIDYSGTARELRERPELLESAYRLNS
jgi:branched-chain amino acid transport system ATP-binding protein